MKFTAKDVERFMAKVVVGDPDGCRMNAWLRQIGLTLLRHPDAIAVPKLQRDVLAKVVLP